MEHHIGEIYRRIEPKATRRSSDNDKTVVTINTSAVDRHGTVFNPEGAELGNYNKNPVFLINHDDRLLAGNGADVRVQEGKLIAEVKDEAWDQEDSEIVRFFNKVKNRVMRMASIGAMPLEMPVEEERADTNGRNDKVMVFNSWELVEFSFVSVGSNPEALVQERRLNSQLLEEIKALRQQVECLPNSLKVQLDDDSVDRLLDEIYKNTLTGSTRRDLSAQAAESPRYVPPKQKRLSQEEITSLTERIIKQKMGKS